MEKSKLIKLLNEALQTEYTDVFSYPRQADKIKEKEVSEKFERFGRMEVRHADNIARQILTLGGKPNWEFTILDIKESIDEMLLDHLEREGKAIKLYQALIEFAEKEEEDELKLILKGIKSEEESHLTEIEELVKRRKQSDLTG